MSRALTDKDPMPFGKHKGKPLEKVPAGYLDWLDGQPWLDAHPGVRDYIAANRSVIDKELKEQELI